MKTLVLCALVLVALISRSFGQALLRPGDTVEIRISGVPQEEIMAFSAPYQVDEAGMLNLPYIKEIRAGGMQANQVQKAIEDKLKSDGIYTHPTITVISGLGQRFISVGGAVRAPGRIPYTSDLTVTAAINAAGGFNEFADKKRVRWVHENKVQVVDTRKISRDPSLDIRVSPGDQIEVSTSWY